MRSLFKKLNFTSSPPPLERSSSLASTPRPNSTQDEIFIKDAKIVQKKTREKEPNIREKYEEIDNQLVLISLDYSQNSLKSVEPYLIQKPYKSLKSLILDNNKIEYLSPRFPEIESLETLWLNNNQISNLNALLEVCKLKLPNVKYLSLLGNPCCPTSSDISYQRYRYFVIYRLPSVKFLDSQLVTEDEREEAIRSFENKVQKLRVKLVDDDIVHIDICKQDKKQSVNNIDLNNGDDVEVLKHLIVQRTEEINKCTIDLDASQILTAVDAAASELSLFENSGWTLTELQVLLCEQLRIALKFLVLEFKQPMLRKEMLNKSLPLLDKLTILAKVERVKEEEILKKKKEEKEIVERYLRKQREAKEREEAKKRAREKAEREYKEQERIERERLERLRKKRNEFRKLVKEYERRKQEMEKEYKRDEEELIRQDKIRRGIKVDDDPPEEHEEEDTVGEAIEVEIDDTDASWKKRLKLLKERHRRKIVESDSDSDDTDDDEEMNEEDLFEESDNTESSIEQEQRVEDTVVQEANESKTVEMQESNDSKIEEEEKLIEDTTESSIEQEEIISEDTVVQESNENKETISIQESHETNIDEVKLSEDTIVQEPNETKATASTQESNETEKEKLSENITKSLIEQEEKLSDDTTVQESNENKETISTQESNEIKVEEEKLSDDTIVQESNENKESNEHKIEQEKFSENTIIQESTESKETISTQESNETSELKSEAKQIESNNRPNPSESEPTETQEDDYFEDIDSDDDTDDDEEPSNITLEQQVL